jgi:isoleucyl-tRNA synthetase
MFKFTKGVDFSELCITSDAKIEKSKSDEIVVKTIKAEGQKCLVCWKINKDQCERHPV